MDNNKIKILVVGPYPPPYSGPESSIKLLLESPFSTLTSTQLFNTNIRKSNNDKGKINIVAFKSFFVLIFKLIQHILIFKPSIIYYYVTATMLGWIYKDIFVIGISLLFRKKVVIHMRAAHFRNNYNKASKIKQFIIRFFISKCSAALAQSPLLTKQFDSLISPERIMSVYNMIDVNKYRPLNFHQENTEFRIFFMGHLQHAKGYCDLLKAIPNVVKEYNSVKFLFAGTLINSTTKAGANITHNLLTGEKLQIEDPVSCYQQYIAGLFDKNYEYLGILNEEQKLNQLRQCDIFVLPSYSEGFSMSVLEALSVGKPVICTPVGALAEVIQDGINGLLIPVGNPTILSQKIIQLLGDIQLRNKICENNIKYVRATFSQEIISQQLFNIMSSIK
ncbi:MAG: glycosyltransferase family 4 protein [Paludibacter sp.]|nr:glycosyltransferase family 4 protein [Paludibacter sp.]